MNINPNSGNSRKEKKMNAITKTGSVAVLVALGLAAAGNGLCAEEPMKQPTASNTPNPAGNIADVFQPVDLRKVKVGGELGRRMEITIEGNLLKLNPDHHIKPFVDKNTRGAEPFIGTGKTLDGMVRLAASTGNPALIARKKQFVETLLGAQEPDGYIGIMPPDIRTWRIYDVHDQAFVIQTLVADYQLFDEKPSLEGARKLADYLIGRWPSKPADWTERVPGNEEIAFIGLDMAFLMLHQTTKDKRYLDFVNSLTINHMKVPEWDREIVLGRHGRVFGHIYAVLSHCQAQLHLYRLDPNPKLLATTRRGMDFLLAKDGMVITGGAGHGECWSNNQHGTGHLGETCATAYQIFMYDELLRMQGEPRWGDLIERTVFNAAFAAQSPDGRRLRYYAPFEGKREYWGSDTYCCPGNYRRLVAALPRLVYYRTGQGIMVNLYTASQTTLDDVGGASVEIRQETDYPNSGRVVIHVAPQKPTAFPLLLRIPQWCSQAGATVNGKPVAATAKPGEFLKIDRTWQGGDTVTLDMPMPWRFVAGRKAQAGRVAIMRGPVVYTLNPARIEKVATAEEPKAPPLGLDIVANYEKWFEQNARHGKPLMVGTQEYKRGLMCHAPSKLVVRLSGPGKTFSSVVGVDANNDPGVKGSVVFSVKVGDKVVFKSDVLRGKMDGVPVNVELGGAKEFTLEVGDAGDGIACDQADWADARVVMADGKEQWLGDMPVRDSRFGTASAVDLKRLVLLPATAELVPDNKSIRPDGTACRIKADLDKADKGAYTLTLTEFPDPDGQWTYFQRADPKVAVEDELMTGTK